MTSLQILPEPQGVAPSALPPAPVEEKNHLDARSVLTAGAYLIALNQLVVNIQPLLLGAMAQGYGLSDRQLGHVSAVYVGATTLATLAAPFWIRKVDWRLFTTIAVVCCVGVFFFGATLRSPELFLLVFGMLGVLKGCFGAPAFAALGDSSSPDRAYGLSVVLQGVLAAAIAFPISGFIVPRFGVSGLFVFLACVYATGLLAARWMPRAGHVTVAASEDMSADPSLFSRAAVAPLIALIATALFVGGILAFWYFVERIGTARGVAPAIIGMTISVTALCSVITSALNTWLGGRLPTIAFIAAGTALLLAAYAVLAFPGAVPFMICNLLFALGWGFAQPAYWAVGRLVDRTGRLFVAAPAASGIAGVVIGLIAGPVIETSGYAGLLWFSAALMIIAMLLAVAVSHRFTSTSA